MRPYGRSCPKCGSDVYVAEARDGGTVVVDQSPQRRFSLKDRGRDQPPLVTPGWVYVEHVCAQKKPKKKP